MIAIHTGRAHRFDRLNHLRPDRPINPPTKWAGPSSIQPLALPRFSTTTNTQQITMGQRVLRTEAAVPALLALAHDRLDALDAEAAGGDGMI